MLSMLLASHTTGSALGLDKPYKQLHTSNLQQGNNRSSYTVLRFTLTLPLHCHFAAPAAPPLQLTLLFKNNIDVDRARQQNVLLSTDVMRGFIANAGQRTGLKIQQGSIKVSPAVNDGGAMSAIGAAPMMPGQLPGVMPGMAPGFGMNPSAPAAAEAPAPKNSAGQAAAQLALPLLAMLAAVVVL
jgi:hypothetical protein